VEEWKFSSIYSFNSAKDRGKWSASHPSENVLGTQKTWARLDAMKKRMFFPPARNEPYFLAQPAHILVSIIRELSWVLANNYAFHKQDCQI
jgi:hypothetical protein